MPPSGIAIALDRLIDAGELAVVLLDDALLTLEARGALATSMPLGRPIDEALPYLAGLAPDLLNLQDEPEATFLLSNVGIAGAEKVNIEAFWQTEGRRYCLLIHKLGLRTAPEAEIIKQIRSRRIAEQHLQQTRQMLTQQQSLLSGLVEAAPIALAIVDRELRYQFATQAWHELFTLGSADLTGRRMTEDSIVVRAYGQSALDQGLAGRTAANMDLAAPLNSDTLQVEARIVPWRRADGPIVGLILTAAPMGALLQRSQTLSREVERLTQANRSLEELIAIAAHDLEAPRRAIDRALDQSPVPGDEIAAHSARIGDLLGELLEHARLAGPAEPGSVDIAAVARSTLATVEDGHRYALDCASVPEQVTALRLPLETIIRNLVANAVRHHDLGRGAIALRLLDRGTRWCLSVTDDGPGIPETDRSAMFEAFCQNDRGRTKGGAGLGLALVAAAARRLDGEITVSSRSDGKRGAVFTLTWPKTIGR